MNNNKYQETEYIKEFNDGNNLNKTKRGHINKTLQYYKDNLEHCRERQQEYAEENREIIRKQSNRRYHWHRSWGGDSDCQFSLLRISLEAFK